MKISDECMIICPREYKEKWASAKIERSPVIHTELPVLRKRPKAPTARKPTEADLLFLFRRFKHPNEDGDGWLFAHLFDREL